MAFMSAGQPSPDIVEFGFSALFSLGFRWIKRNPSNLLRFVLFPFGGLQVDRWPRFLLWCVRFGGIAGFFFFCLSALHSLYPLNAKDSGSEGALYVKLILALGISIFALRGAGEEIPEPASSAARSHPLVISSGNVSGANAAGSSSTQSTPSASAAPQPTLSDAEAPPIPRRAYPESLPGETFVRARKRFALSAVVYGLCWTALCFVVGATGMAVFFAVLSAVLAALKLYTKNKAPIATCPFCLEQFEGYGAAQLLHKPIRCPFCSEYSQFSFGLLAPIDPNGPLGIAEKPLYESPLYENGVWPNGCVLCGAAPTRFDESDHLRFLLRRFAVPLSGLMVPHPAAHAFGIPYCDLHRDAVQVVAPKELFSSPSKYFPGFAERNEKRRQAFLLWRSLPMMRRYLAANKRSQSVVSKGYRAPNLFQRIVSGSWGSGPKRD